MTRSLRTKAMLAALTLAVGVLAACGPGEHKDDGQPGPGPNPDPGAGASMSLFAGSLKRAGSEDGTGEAAGFNQPEGVAQDSAGNVYVADTGNHTVRKLAPNGVVTTLAGTPGSSGSADGTGAAARFSSPRGIAVDASGNLYVADTGNHTVRRVAPDGVVTTVAGAAGQAGTADGPAATARLKSPTDIAVGAGGVLLVGGDSAVRRVAIDGAISTFAGAAGQSSVVAGDGAQARFTDISGVAIDGSGNVYVSEATSSAGRLRRFDAQAKSVPLGTVSTGILSTPLAAGIAVGAGGNVYIASGGTISLDLPGASPGAVQASAVFRVAPQGAITLIAGSASGYGSVTLTTGEARVGPPMGIVADSAGRVVFADATNHSIRRIDAQQQLSTLAGGAGMGRADGSGAVARFSTPMGLAATTDGGLYLADPGNFAVRKISQAGAVSTVMLQSEDDRPRNLFGVPTEVAVNPQGGFYLATSGGDDSLWSCTAAGRCKALDSDSTTSHHGIAFANGNLYLAEGSQASVIGSNGVKRVLANDFGFASAIAASPAGKVYVADTRNHTVRIFDSAGKLLQTVGSGSGYRDGAAAQAQFAAPSGLALDAAGNLYIAEDINRTVRKLSADGGTVSTVAGAADKPGAPQMGPATGVLGVVHGLAWQNSALYVTVDNAVVKINPVN